MDYKRLFEQVRTRLDSLGVNYSFYAARPVLECWDIWGAQYDMKRMLPKELCKFYLDMGDGLSFRWESEPENGALVFANLQMPSLESLVRQYFDWRNCVCYSPENAAEYGFPHTANPQLAIRTAARMWDWLPILYQGNGDQICIDLSEQSCPVIFHKHDWMDGGSGENGFLLAENWNAFVTGWAGVCFQWPKSLFWDSELIPAKGVNWEGAEFLAPFRISDLKTAPGTSSAG